MHDNLKPLSLLILSDIHFGASAISEDFAINSEPPEHLIEGAISMKESLIEAIRNEKKKIDAILIAGDLTTAGGPSEFKECFDSSTEPIKK